MAKKTGNVTSGAAISAMVEKDDLKQVYLFCGPEEYLKTFFVSRLIKRIGVDREAVKQFDGKVSPDDLLDAAEASPLLLAETMVVVVRESGLFKGAGANLAASYSFLKDLSEDCFVIFKETEADKTNSLYKLVSECGAVIECMTRPLSEVVNTLSRKAAMNGVSITPDAARLLYDGIGNDLYGLYNEVDRLSLLLRPGGIIDGRLVSEESPLSIDAKMYDFTDAVVEKNYDKALKWLKAMLDDKVPPQYILASIARHFQLLYNVRYLADDRLGAGEIASELSIQEFLAKKYIRQSEIYGKNGISLMLDNIADMDMRSKSGLIDPLVAVETVISMTE